MSPDSENNQADPSNDPLPGSPPPAGSPSPTETPGGVIKPNGIENPPPPNPVAESVPPPDNLPQSSVPLTTTPQTTGPQPGVNPNDSVAGKEIFPSDPIGPAGGNTQPGFPKKKLLMIALPVFLVLLITGYVFGFYIPNKPENVYKTGLDRSGEALQMILDKATEQETYDKYKKSEVTAGVEINYGEENIKGDFTAKYDDTKLDSDLNLNFPTGESQQADLGLSILSETAEGKEFPDTYLNVRGIKALGADLFIPGIGKYDGKWIAIPSDYLQSIAADYGVEAKKQQNNNDDYPTFDEVSALIHDAYGPTNEYVFTSDPEKAVFVNKQYLGKEDVDGAGAYHYEVGFNKDNYKAYCEAVSNVVLSSPVYKKLSSKSDEDVESEKQKISENCQKDSESIKDDDTFEMWVDSKYKLIKKIRLYDSEEKKGYYEIGQNYDGGDAIGFFFKIHADADSGGSETEFTGTITTDFNTGESSGEITFYGGEDASKYDGKITLSMKPLTGDFEITKPTNTVSIEKILKLIGVDPESLVSLYGGSPGVASGINDQSNDALIKSNILSIYSSLEVYYAENGYYPTASQFNSQDWRSANVSSLSEDALSTPYNYSPSDCNADGCQKYTLSAKLSSGKQFKKTNSF